MESQSSLLLKQQLRDLTKKPVGKALLVVKQDQEWNYLSLFRLPLSFSYCNPFYFDTFEPNRYRHFRRILGWING